MNVIQSVATQAPLRHQNPAREILTFLSRNNDVVLRELLNLSLIIRLLVGADGFWMTLIIRARVQGALPVFFPAANGERLDQINVFVPPEGLEIPLGFDRNRDDKERNRAFLCFLFQDGTALQCPITVLQQGSARRGAEQFGNFLQFFVANTLPLQPLLPGARDDQHDDDFKQRLEDDILNFFGLNIGADNDEDQLQHDGQHELDQEQGEEQNQEQGQGQAEEQEKAQGLEGDQHFDLDLEEGVAPVNFLRQQFTFGGEELADPALLFPFDFPGAFPQGQESILPGDQQRFAQAGDDGQFVDQGDFHQGLPQGETFLGEEFFLPGGFAWGWENDFADPHHLFMEDDDDDDADGQLDNPFHDHFFQ